MNNKKRNKFIESEKMSKLFTKKRRVLAKNDFQDRVQMNLIKQKLRKKELEKKYYDFSFKPQINKKKFKGKRNKSKKIVKYSQRDIDNKKEIIFNEIQSEDENYQCVNHEIKEVQESGGNSKHVVDVKDVMTFNPNSNEIYFDEGSNIPKYEEYEGNEGARSPGFPSF